MANKDIAILSDIHGNYEALTRVLEDIEKEDISDVICLGDTFGYGPNQLECYDTAKNFDIHLKGNHEVLTAFQLKNMTAELETSAFEISHSAAKAIRYIASELIGKKQIKSSITGEFFELPEETLDSLISDEYDTFLAEAMLQKISKEIKIETPEIGKWQRLISNKIPKETQDKIINSSLNQLFFKNSELMDEYYERIKRAKKVKEIYQFLRQKDNKYSYKKGNALFVHDDPLEPGSTKYLFDDKTGKKAKLSVKNRVAIEKINPEKFEGINYVFVGHTHILPNQIDINGVNVAYVGSVGIPRKDNVKQKYACYTIITMDENEHIIDVKGKRLKYFWQKTQRKMQKACLIDKFDEILKSKNQNK